MKFFWFLPTGGDGQYLGSDKLAREGTANYYKQVAQAVDSLGYEGILVPTGKTCEDPWVVASSLINETENLKFLLALRPGIISPTVAARMSAAFQRLSKGRLLINVVTGGDPKQLAGDGIHLSKEDLYKTTDQFLDIWKGVMTGESVSYNGSHLQVTNGELLFPADVEVPLYFGGSSAYAQDVAAKHIDHYLTWGETPDLVKEKITKVSELAKVQGRELKFGMRIHVIVRETSEEAWAAANKLITHVKPEHVEAARKEFLNSASEGQRRMAALHKGDRNNLEIYPNIWAGIGLVRGGAGTAIVGNPEEVADRLREYEAIGIESFILSGYPHLEEAYRFAELVVPIIDGKEKKKVSLYEKPHSS